MANMAIEAGAKNGIFAVDDVTLDYIKDKVDREYKIYKADDDAEYEAEYTIDLSQIKPTVAFRICLRTQEHLTISRRSR